MSLKCFLLPCQYLTVHFLQTERFIFFKTLKTFSYNSCAAGWTYGCLTRFSTCVFFVLLLHVHIESSSRYTNQEPERNGYPRRCLQSCGHLNFSSVYSDTRVYFVLCGGFMSEKRQQQHDAYSLLTARHFFDAITSPSLCTKQVNSSNIAGRNSLFTRVLLSFIKRLCQLFWLLPDQVKLKAFSHSLAQVSTQVNVRLSPPGPRSEVTAKTNMRGNVMMAVTQKANVA